MYLPPPGQLSIPYRWGIRWPAYLWRLLNERYSRRRPSRGEPPRHRGGTDYGLCGDWARSCPGEASEDVLSALADEDGTGYLIPELEGDFETWLQRNYQTIFEHELWAWHTDESFWPNDRSFEAIQTLFEVRFHSMVLDMGEDPIERDCLL